MASKQLRKSEKWRLEYALFVTNYNYLSTLYVKVVTIAITCLLQLIRLVAFGGNRREVVLGRSWTIPATVGRQSVYEF